MNFPSGPWTGFYNYCAGQKKHGMDLRLTFAERKVFGDGCDDVGRFVISGRFDETNAECYWTKTYVGAHDVFYRGFHEGKGIWGIWKLEKTSGGFHIWPLDEGECEMEQKQRQEAPPVEPLVAPELRR
jgi:hypothetical protein